MNAFHAGAPLRRAAQFLAIGASLALLAACQKPADETTMPEAASTTAPVETMPAEPVMPAPSTMPAPMTAAGAYDNAQGTGNEAPMSASMAMPTSTDGNGTDGAHADESGDANPAPPADNDGG